MRLLLDVLRTVDFLADGPADAVAQFQALGRVRELPRGHVLWRAGHRPQSVVVPVTGELAGLGRDPGGRGICYAFFGTGDAVGVPAAVDGLPHAREMRVIRGGEFFVVERTAFLRFLEARAEVRPRVVALIGRILRHSLDERDRDVFLPVHARVARFLAERVCVRRDDGARILLRETQPEIAIRLGSVREVVAREMAAFRDEGLLRRTAHGLFVSDWAGLRAKAAIEPAAPGECDAESAEAALRTRRFFLPVLEGGESRVADESRVCAEHVTGFRACAARGCPLALARGPSGELRPAESAFPRPSVPVRRPAPPVPAEPHRHAPPSHETLSRHRTKDDAVVRSPAEEAEIRRRIELYRRRVAGIETQFGGEDHVPTDASLFQ